jgi:hypothetical protein
MPARVQGHDSETIRASLPSKPTKTYQLSPQISIRQNFRLNGQDHYTIFDVPISVTNRIDFGFDRPPCDELNNPLLEEDQIDARAANSVGVLFAPGDATQVQSIDKSKGDGLGSSRGGAVNGLGSAAAARPSRSGGALWACGLGAAALSIFV